MSHQQRSSVAAMGTGRASGTLQLLPSHQCHPDDSLRHIVRQHGNEKRKGQLSIRRRDMLALPDILRRPDIVKMEPGKTKTGLHAIRLLKRTAPGVVTIVELRTKKKKLALTSMWRYRLTGKKEGNKDRQHTSKTDSIRENAEPSVSAPRPIIDPPESEDKEKHSRESEFVERYAYIARDPDLRSAIERAVGETDTSPTESQKASGNYRKGKFSWNGLEIAIENPRGSVRSGKNRLGVEWSVTMPAHYGYIRRTESEADGDHVDCFVGPHPESQVVFVIDQRKDDGKFDEHKVMLGCDSEDQARELYRSAYQPGWKGLQSITPLTTRQFKAWLDEGHTGKPIAGQVSKYSGRQSPIDRYAKLPQGQVYVAGDGDGIGSQVEKAALSDDVDAIQDISNRIDAGQQVFRAWVEEHEGQMVIAGGDDFSAILDAEALDDLDSLRERYRETVGASVTIGVGRSVSEGARAMVLGKLKGKDQVVTWSDDAAAELKELSQGRPTSERDKLREEGLIDYYANPNHDPKTGRFTTGSAGKSSHEKAANELTQLRTVRGSDQVKTAAKAFLNKPITNTETGMSATVSGASLGKMLSKSAREKSVDQIAHLNAVANLDTLFRHAVLRLSRPDRRGDLSIKRIHHFDVPFPHEGKVFRGKILAKEYTDVKRGMRLYEVSAVKIEEAHVNRGRPDAETSDDLPPVGFTDQFTRLAESVQQKLPKNGRPLWLTSETFPSEILSAACCRPKIYYQPRRLLSQEENPHTSEGVRVSVFRVPSVP